jgi:hypothetical protein
MRYEGTLREVVDRLEDKLVAVRRSCDEFVIVEAGSYYTQVLCNVDAIYGEMVSNAYLRDTAGPLLTAADEARLVAFGWNAPGTPCHALCECEHQNFNRVWSPATPTADIVHDLLLPLIAVGTRHEGERLAIIWDERSYEPSVGLPTAH